MAIAFSTFAGNNDNTTTGTSLAVTITVNVGDCVVVQVGRDSTQAVSTVTDTGSNTYTKQNSFTTSAPACAIFTTIATASATSVTANYTAGSKTTVVIATYTGVASIGTNTNTNHASATVATITCTLANANNWAVAGISDQSVSTTMTANTGNFRGQKSTNASNPSQSAIVDNTGSTSVVCSVNHVASGTYTAEFVELVPTGSTGTFEDDSFNVNTVIPVEPQVTIWQ